MQDPVAVSGIRSKGRRGFTAAPNWRISDPDLDSYEFRIAVWLASHVDDWCEDHVTRNFIAKATGISGDKVSKSMATLERLGIVEKHVAEVAQSEGGKRWVVWFDHSVWETDPGRQTTTPQSCDDHPPVARRPPPGRVTTATTGDLSEKTSEKTNARIASSDTPQSLDLELAHPPGERDSFAEFWELYPKRLARGAAEKAWKTAIKKTAPEVILDALRARIDWWQKSRTEKPFIPYPATWLNQKRWLDELEPIERAKALTATQAAADTNQIVLAEMETALDSGDFDGAWAIVRTRAAASGDQTFLDIDDQLAKDVPLNLIAQIVYFDGAPVDRARIDQVVDLRERMSSRARGSGPALGKGST
jgi:hypothetical protein